jgi:hypothetical protein
MDGGHWWAERPESFVQAQKQENDSDRDSPLLSVMKLFSDLNCA